MQTPPVQLVEQQSAPSPHASPSVRHVLFVGPAESASHFPALQTPEQQSDPAAQDSAVWRHALLEHEPPTQRREQQSAPESQATPTASQNRPDAQVPEAQVAEQHCESAPHDAPPARQRTSGRTHVPPAPQSPSQHSWSPLQLAPSPTHTSGLTQTCAPTAPAQEPVQQSPPSSHGSPTKPPQLEASAQVKSTQAPSQQSEPTEQAAPTGSQSAFTQRPPPGPSWQFPEQHSAPEEQAAPSWAAVHSAGGGGSASALLHAVTLAAARSRAASREGESLVGRMWDPPPV
jgi:hypothetical protein